MKKRVTAAVCMATAMLLVSLTACGSGTATQEAAKTESSTGIANPNKYDLTKDEAEKLTGIALPAPEGAQEVSYNVIGYQDEHPTMEMQFKLNGKTWYLRARSTGATSIFPEEMGMDERGTVGDDKVDQLMKIADLPDSEDVNISGIYGEWESIAAGNTADRDTLEFSGDEGSVIAWVDSVPGILYNLSTTDSVEEEELAQTMSRVFVPVQKNA